MEKLIASGMFGKGLVRVNTPQLVGRYNDCLLKIGVEPTNQTQFQIDGIGWSPEIAMEKGTANYFSPELTNQFGIILTLSQRGLPVYIPFHSFDRVLLEEFFRIATKQIADITTVGGVWLDFAHDLIGLRSPLDLLSMENIVLRAYDTLGIQESAKSQRDLIREFREADMTWADQEVRAKIIQSGQMHGDLRFRSIIIPDLPFTDVRCFHTRAFGGVFVLRDIAEKPILILEDHQVLKGSDFVSVIRINDSEILRKLKEFGVLEFSLAWHKKNVDVLETVRYFGLAELFYSDESNGKLNFDELTSAQQKQWGASVQKNQPEWIHEIGLLISRLRAGDSVKNIKVSLVLENLLLRPSRVVQESFSALRTVEQVLARVMPMDIERLFSKYRTLFYGAYSSWPDGKKKWAIEYLLKRGYPKSQKQKK